MQPTYDADSKRSINYTYRRKLAATIHIHRRHLVLLLSSYADLILPSHGEMEDWVDLDMHSSNDAQPVPKAVYHSDCCEKTQPSAVWFEPGSSHSAVGRANH